jgi:murein DD-endopeptidase MepM/ murein hydrolase activator NlpD
MAGKIGGVIAVAALMGGLFWLAAPGEATEGECGPLTLDQLFPHLDVHGQPIPTTTTTVREVPAVPNEGAAPSTSETTSTTAGGGEATSTTQAESTTTTVASTTTTTAPTTTVAPTPTTEAPPPAPVPTEPCTSWVYEMVWPLGVESRVFSGFGVDRDGGARRHKGNDLPAPKMAPVVAVADGTVTAVHSTPPDDCCWILITHADGWQSLYVHLNNDTWRTDDGLGHGVRPGLVAGDTVVAGEVIGWVGDSGNAESTVPHIHFELRHPDGYSVDPHASLQAARDAAGDLPHYTGAYVDVAPSVLGFELTRLVTQGVFWNCDDRGLMFCPHALAQPADVVELIRQLTGLEAPMVAATQRALEFQETIPAEHILDVLGCESLAACLQSGITAGDLARLALWVNLTQRHLAASPDVDPGLELQSAIQAENGLRVLGIVGICHESIDADRLVTRAEAAAMLSWWILENGATCAQSDEPTS